MMNPFDIRAALLAKHAQHVVLIHFPIALFVTGVAFDFLAQWTKRAVYTAAAYCNFTFAAITTIPVLISGLVAWQLALEGQRLKGVLLQHLVLGWTSGVLIWVVWFIHMRTQWKQESVLPVYRWPVEVAAVAVVAFTGHLGGFLSGVNGQG